MLKEEFKDGKIVGPTPREVPVQAYQSRQEFSQDLSMIYNKLKKIVESNTHDGMDEIKSMIRSSAQRIKGQEKKYPKVGLDCEAFYDNFGHFHGLHNTPRAKITKIVIKLYQSSSQLT